MLSKATSASERSSKFTGYLFELYQPTSRFKLNLITSITLKIMYSHVRFGLQRTNMLKNSQDNDKSSPDLNAAQTIIHVAEHKVKSFTALRTHLHEFYEFLDLKKKPLTIGRHAIKRDCISLTY